MTDYHSNIEINAGTEPNELIEYTKEQTKNPVEIKNTFVYNYSTHKVDKDALAKAVDGKLERELYRIPMQIMTGEAFIQSILPEKIKQAEILMYRPDEKDYYAYNNYIRNVPVEKRQNITQKIASIIQEHDHMV
jgi:hypothetical protein